MEHHIVSEVRFLTILTLNQNLFTGRSGTRNGGYSSYSLNKVVLFKGLHFVQQQDFLSKGLISLQTIIRSSRPDVHNSQENACDRVSFLIKLQARGRCFPVNFAKFLRTPFLKEYLWWLLLEIATFSFIFQIK